MNHLSARQLLWGFSVIALAGALGAAVWTGLGTGPRQGGWDERPLEGLNQFGAVPDFSLIETSGKRLELSDLRETVWVADFIYTSCTDTCPLQSAEMAKFQEKLPESEAWRLVSFSVDPEHDTPAVLSRYAERFGADPERWLFLTGDRQTLYRLVREGFRLSVAPAPGAADTGQRIVLHSSRFVLVDRQAQIRGYYDSRDPEALRRLLRDARQLLKAEAWHHGQGR